ncbi:MAG: glutaredoxin [Dehalococcoidia bacterium]|nr:glutaredoxin [Dehalococcoidia bacterium]MBF8304251.1 glutaredoxin [Dehalococcoidia bacterium]
MIRLTFYSKPNCPLCDEARDMLEDLNQEFALVVTEINILSNPAIYEKYKYIIPVLELENGQVIKARFTEAELRKALIER